VAIVGEDWLANWKYDGEILLKIPIGRGGNEAVKIVLAVDKDSGVTKLQDLPLNCSIATEYVQLAEDFFKKNGREDIDVIPSWGGTETKTRFGAAGIIDVTESGESLRANNLEIIQTIMTSCTVVVANKKALEVKEKQPLIDYFVRLLSGAVQASRYIKMIANVPDGKLTKAAEIIGGLKGPTVSPLIDHGMFAIESFVLKENEQYIIFALLQEGITDIAVERDIPLIMS
jgi:ATP phosphoribosyltransferase